MSKDRKDEDLVSLSMSILDKPQRSYKIDKDGVFKEDQEQVNTWEEFFRLYSDPLCTRQISQNPYPIRVLPS